MDTFLAKSMVHLGVDVTHSIMAREIGISRLPIQSPKEDLEALGFVFGEHCDELMMHVLQSPEGWKMKHIGDVHNHLLDDKGSIRGHMGYRGSYDTYAILSLNSRYGVEFDAEPLPPLVKEKRWCLMGKERGYDVVTEIKPKGWKKPKRKAVDFDIIDYHEGRIQQRQLNAFGYGFGRDNDGPVYKEQMVDVHETEPKPYYERTHRYVVKDRREGVILFAGEWMNNGDHTVEAKAKEETVVKWLVTNFPDHGNRLAYW